jgi:hypothetical protein
MEWSGCAAVRGGCRGRRRPGVELALGVGGGLNRGAARGQPRLERRPRPGRGWLGETVAAEGFTGGSDGVDRIGFGPRGGGQPAWAGPAPPPARDGQPGTGSGRRHSRRCPRWSTVGGRCGGWPAPAAAGSRPGRRRGHLVDHGAGGGRDNRGGVGVLVGVDPETRSTGSARMCIALTPCISSIADDVAATGGHSLGLDHRAARQPARFSVGVRRPSRSIEGPLMGLLRGRRAFAQRQRNQVAAALHSISGSGRSRGVKTP